MRTTNTSKGSSPRAKKKTTSKKKVATTSAKRSSKASSNKRSSSALGLSEETLKTMYELMLRARLLEERMIQVYRRGDAYFWIGSPGEEAFGVALGMNVLKGQGPQYDYLHLHYRGTPTLLAMGMDEADALRLIMNKSTDPSTGGRNFSNHYCFPKWNVAPVSSPIEIQYPVAIGTAISQRRVKDGKSVSIITGGDAGSAEGDFASSLIWATRPGFELPMYITVQNNGWGISTPFHTQHGEEFVSDRGKAFRMRTGTYNGNDPVSVYKAIQEDLEYIRETRKPVLSEFMISRLNGHSSASGANRDESQEDPLLTFEEQLLKVGVYSESELAILKDLHFERIKGIADDVRKEPEPKLETLWDHTYVNNENADWRKF